MAIPIPPAFLQWSTELRSRKFVIAVQIDGVDDLLASQQVGTLIRYGDGSFYGELIDGEPIRYGGLRPYTTPSGGTVKRLLDFDGSSLVLAQVLEQEQGRASISQLTLSFVDKDNYMTRLCSPGVVVPEILGRDVKVYIGGQEISYPDQYYLAYRGRVQTVRTVEKKVILQLGDPNLKRRRTVFFAGKTALNAELTSAATTVNVISNGDFHEKILGPDGTYDDTVKCYLKIEDEFIEYQQTGQEATGFGTNQFLNVLRGQKGTSDVTHPIGTEVSAWIELEGNPLDIALKVMLSGWNGPFKTGQDIDSIVFTGDPSIGDVANSMTLPEGINAVIDLGLSIGDFVTISGDPNPANNNTFSITDFFDVSGYPNRGIVLTGPMTLSPATPATCDFRSQFDTWPVSCGTKLYPFEVDVQGHIDLKEQRLAQELMRFFLGSTEQSAKAFIESELYLPVSAYSISQNGQLSVKITAPPIAGQTLPFLTWDDVTNAPQLSLERGLTNRNFFNQIDFDYDPSDFTQSFQRTFRALDIDSLSDFEVLSILPMRSRGTRADLTTESFLASRASRLLSRYARAAILMKFTISFAQGSMIQVGDIVALRDDGQLQIPNFNNGTRNSGVQLLEVKQRDLDLRQGNIKLTLLSGVGFDINDVFGTWAPSSQCVASGSTTTSIRFEPSFGSQFGLNEWRKWKDYVGNRIIVHNYDYTQSSETVIETVSESNFITCTPALSFTPDATHIIDLAPYSTSTDKLTDEASKIIHCFWDRAAPIVTGISNTQFDVDPSDTQFFIVGRTILVRKDDYTDIVEVEITDVTGDTITTTDLGYTPDNTYLVELLAWYDGRGPYRFA